MATTSSSAETQPGGRGGFTRSVGQLHGIARSGLIRLVSCDARRISRRATRLWKGLRSLVLNLVGAVTLVGLIIVPLVDALTTQTITIAPLLVPQELEHGGTTPVVAAQRLRDALRRLGERASAPVRGPHLAAYEDPVVVSVGHSAHDDLPEFVVPTVGLSIEAIAAYIRTYLGIRSRRNISGEITLVDNHLRLRLRLNGRMFYDSPSGVELNKVDQLFAMAAQDVFDVTEPYLSVAALADKDPDRAFTRAQQIVADCSASETSVNCPDARQAGRWHNLLGSMLQYRYNLREAMVQYDKAIEKEPSFAVAHSNRAGLFREKGDIKSAAAGYRKALELDPHFAAARFNLATTLRADKGHDNESKAEGRRAVTEYRDAILSNPGAANAHVDFGNSLLSDVRYEPDVPLQERKCEEAIEQFRRALEIDPQNVAAHFGLGRALDRLGETLPAEQQGRKDYLEKAVDAFRQAVALAPRFEDAYYDLGLVLRRLGKLDDAKQAFETAKDQHELAIRHDSSNARAHRELGRLLYSGDRDGAIRQFEKAIDIEHDFADAYRAHGLAKFFEGQFDRAASDLSLVVKKRPDDPYWILWLYLAEARRSPDPTSRANAQRALEGRSVVLSRHIWPYAVVDLFMGRKMPDETRSAAIGNAVYECESHFYIGEWHLLQGHDRDAWTDLTEARRSCPMEFVEFLGAEADLPRLKTSQTGSPPSTPPGDH
jgi:tetratricopeptide (TPR) repeat protein